MEVLHGVISRPEMMPNDGILSFIILITFKLVIPLCVWQLIP